jgi:catechol 2,3-dioxygenase-like lactoylglutathione lyase family enzyme
MSAVTSSLLFILVTPCAWLAAWTPDPPMVDRAIYGHVSHVGWVVKDVDDVAARWRALGVVDQHADDIVEVPGLTSQGKATALRFKRVTARFANATVHWIQPLDDSVLARFLRTHGEGVHHLAFAVPSAEQFDEELARLHAAGVDPTVGGPVKTRDEGSGRFAYLDTATRGGGVTIELTTGIEPAGADPIASNNDEPLRQVTQYAFVTRDVEQVGAFYRSIGFGELPIKRNVSLDRRLRGQPGKFEMLLGFARVADVVFEWIQSVVGPSVYDEYLAQHGEGFHHLGFNVTDMDAAVAKMQTRGLAVTMSGGWNENGYEGRFAYLDSEKFGGVTIELLWNKPR